MYHSFVFPYLIYCVEIWGNASAIHLDPFKKILKKTMHQINLRNGTIELIIKLHDIQ